MGTKAVKPKTIQVTREIKIYKKKCAVCGTAFEGISIAKFCSRVCRNASDYAKHARARRAKRMEKYRLQK